eukprot:s188_g31.t1
MFCKTVALDLLSTPLPSPLGIWICRDHHEGHENNLQLHCAAYDKCDLSCDLSCHIVIPNVGSPRYVHGPMISASSSSHECRDAEGAETIAGQNRAAERSQRSIYTESKGAKHYF